MLSVGGVLILVKALGFVKQMVIASVFGANMETDLINLSHGFIGNAQYLLVQVLLTSVVSVYIRIREEDHQEAGRFATDTLRAATVISGGCALVIFIFAHPIARLLAPSYSDSLSQQLGIYLRIFAPLLVLFAWMAVFHALLNANERFVPGQLEGLYQSIILIVLSVLGARLLGVNALTAGYLIYGVATVMILWLQSRHYLAPSRGNPFQSPHIRSLLIMSGPLFIGYGAIYINQMVDKVLVSGLESGTVTAMSYASVLINLVGTLLGSLCSILYAHMTGNIAKKKDKAVAKLATRASILLTAAVIPVSIVTVLHAQDIVTLVYKRGAFGTTEVYLTALALMGYGFSLIPIIWRNIYSQLQYGYQDSKHPTINGLIGIGTNIVLSVALCPIFGIFGVAFASSFATFIAAVLNVISARRVAPALSLRPFVGALPFLSVGTLGAVLIAIGCASWWSGFPVFVRLCLTSLCVFGIYGLLISPLLWRLGLFHRLFQRLG